MTRLGLAMTTAPRRRSTIRQAVASLRDAGFDENLRVFAEPGCPAIDLGAGVVTFRNARTLGCFRNWRQALHALVDARDVDWLLVLQDDAVWAAGAAAVLRAQIASSGRASGVGFLSCYVTGKDVGAGFGDGWNVYDGGWDLWGALALCMPRAAAVDLLRYPLFARHRASNAVDAVVSLSLQRLGRTSYVHVPSLVDHVGDTSTMGHDDVAAGLRGYRFDDARLAGAR